MSLGLLLCVGFIALVAYFVLTAPQRRAQNNTTQADALLAAGERALLVGDLDNAQTEFSRARVAAKQGLAPVFEAEASYGLARVAEKRGRLDEAATHLRDALSVAPRLSHKPNYIKLLERHLDEVESARKRS